MKIIQFPQAGEPATAPIPANPSHRILVVDDDAGFRELKTEVQIHYDCFYNMKDKTFNQIGGDPCH
jgi:hypothetical protein